MSVYFESALRDVLQKEGIFSDDPVDRGGATKYGITEALARLHGYVGDMRDLSLDKAKDIYKVEFWDPLRCDQIAAHSQAVANELFDTGVNMGTRVAVTFLQRALNALNRNRKDYADIVMDGKMGQGTIGALQAYFSVRGRGGEAVLMKCLNALQGARYIEICANDPMQERFLYGWIDKRV